VLANHRTAPIEPPLAPGLRATLDLLQKVTLAPGEVTSRDVDAVRAAGVSDEAVEDALTVCACFNLIDRVADSLGFDCPPVELHAAYAERFLEEGYGNET
jgi:alkylhydroperoxidase family enzyme